MALTEAKLSFSLRKTALDSAVLYSANPYDSGE